MRRVEAGNLARSQPSTSLLITTPTRSNGDVGAEVVLHHPLRIRFALHGPGILHAERGCDLRAQRSSSVAGVMLSTIERGKPTWSSIQPARPRSTRRA